MESINKILNLVFISLLLVGCIAFEEAEVELENESNVSIEEAELPEEVEEESELLNVSFLPEVILLGSVEEIFSYDGPLNCSINDEDEDILLLVDGERFQITVLSSIELEGLNGIIYDGSEYFVWSEEKALKYKPEDIINMAGSLEIPKENLGMHDKEMIMEIYSDSNVNCSQIELTGEEFIPPDRNFTSFTELFPQSDN